MHLAISDVASFCGFVNQYTLFIDDQRRQNVIIRFCEIVKETQKNNITAYFTYSFRNDNIATVVPLKFGNEYVIPPHGW